MILTADAASAGAPPAFRGGVLFSNHLGAPDPVAAADAAAGPHGYVYLDASYTLAKDAAVSALWIGAGGILTVGGHALTGSFTAQPDVQMFSVTASGHVVDTMKGPVWAPWFGVKGDGTTDDYPAMTAALWTCLHAQDQGTLMLPRGEFNLNTLPLYINGCSVGGMGSDASTFRRGNSASGLYTVVLDGSMGSAYKRYYWNWGINGNDASNSNANYLLQLKGNALFNKFQNLVLNNAKTGCIRTSEDASGTPNMDTFEQVVCQNSAGAGAVLDAGNNLSFSSLDIEGSPGIGVNVTGADRALSFISFPNIWLERDGTAGVDAFVVGAGSDHVMLSGQIVAYGNSAGTAGNGIDCINCNFLTVDGVKPTPAAGRYGRGHYSIELNGASSPHLDSIAAPDDGGIHYGSASNALMTNTSISSPAWNVSTAATTQFASGADFVVPFDTNSPAPNFDKADSCDFAKNRGRCSPKIPGKYMITCHVAVTAKKAPGDVARIIGSARVRLNGSTFVGVQDEMVRVPHVSDPTIDAGVTTVLPLNGSTDYVECTTYSDSTSPRLVGSLRRNYMAGAWVSP